jgi:protein-disulfide isomerase
VRLVEYGGYECPYCGAAYPAVKEAQALMGDRIRFVFRNFPITTSHPQTQKAAEAAEAAAAQGRFWTARHDDSYDVDTLLAALEEAAAPERGTG